VRAGSAPYPGPAADQTVSELQRRVEKLVKINAALMQRVERSMDQQANAFSLFQTAISLEAQVRVRTEELKSALNRLERANDDLTGARDAAERANRFKYLFGGAMRQSGILAAAGLYGLEHNVDRLRDDNANAARLASGLADLGLSITPPESNMVFCDPPQGMDSAAFSAVLTKHGVRASTVGARVRMVTHLGVSRDDVDAAITAVKKAVRR